MKLVDMTLTGYIEEVMSDSPAPGGGSASALAGAQGAALAAMVAGLTIGKKKYPLDQELCTAAIAEGKRLAEMLRVQIDRDTEAYNLIASAYKLPKEDEKDKIVRFVAIADATLAATEVPFETLQYAHSGLMLASSLVGHSNANCASDLACAGLNLLSCARGAWMNVLINLPGVTNEARAAELGTLGQSMINECEALGEEIYRSLKATVEA